MPFADKRSNGMSAWNKYKSQIVSEQKDSWSRPLKKLFTFRKCHCKYTAKFICFKHDASQPHPKCHLGNMSSLSNIAQLKPINTITSLGTAKDHTLKLNTVLLLKGTWNVLNLDRVHLSSFLQGSQRAPCLFARRTGLCENVTPKLLVCEGVSEEPWHCLWVPWCRAPCWGTWTCLATADKGEALTRAKQSCKYLLQGPRLG